MKIHKDEYQIILDLELENYKRRDQKIVLRIVENTRCFRNNQYENVIDIIKALMDQAEYIKHELNYSKRTLGYAMDGITEIICGLTRFVETKCHSYLYQYKDDEKEDVNTMFYKSKPIDRRSNKLTNNSTPKNKLNYSEKSPQDLDRNLLEDKELKTVVKKIETEGKKILVDSNGNSVIISLIVDEDKKSIQLNREQCEELIFSINDEKFNIEFY